MAVVAAIALGQQRTRLLSVMLVSEETATFRLTVISCHVGRQLTVQTAYAGRRCPSTEAIGSDHADKSKKTYEEDRQCRTR